MASEEELARAVLTKAASEVSAEYMASEDLARAVLTKAASEASTEVT
jgi:hypothetical protein